MAGINQVSNLQAQVDKAQAQNASYQAQLEAQQRSLAGTNAYKPSYTQTVAAPISYVPQQGVVQQWQPQNAGLPVSYIPQQGVVQQWQPRFLGGQQRPSIGGIDSLSRIANYAEGGITHLVDDL